jgi:triosephosphate isomerase
MVVDKFKIINRKTMRKKIVAANWKMNLLEDEALQLAHDFQQLAKSPAIELYIFPPMLYLSRCIKQVDQIHFGAQNGYSADFGAFTGEVSMYQLKQNGVTAVLIGHSERRAYFGESNHLLKTKVDAAITHGLTPFFCCGEDLEVREIGAHLTFVRNQLTESLFHLSPEDFQKVVIAYEPVWAIGTGLTASTEQAEEMHAAIRGWITEQYNSDIASNCSILYGGSCNPANAKELFSCPNVDGGLIGGAALNASDFSVLIATDTWTTSK